MVTELAGGLRLYSRAGIQLTESYGDDDIPPGAAGITLAPWANRVEDGVWYLNGKKQQLRHHRGGQKQRQPRAAAERLLRAGG